jgi:hypothetical protein
MAINAPLNKSLAAHDLRRAGCEIRLIDGDLYTVRNVLPLDDDNVRGWLENDIMMRNAWTGMRTTGTNPTLFDTGDPQSLALIVERNHDYPDPDMLGHYTTEQ